jgi:hypothetical protein
MKKPLQWSLGDTQRMEFAERGFAVTMKVIAATSRDHGVLGHWDLRWSRTTERLRLLELA